jgi:hypothetical protein
VFKPNGELRGGVLEKLVERLTSEKRTGKWMCVCVLVLYICV